MYKHSDGSILQDNDPVTAPDGTNYPGNWDKAALPFLSPITETASPESPGQIATGWHIEGMTQIWDTRPATASETNAPIYTTLDEIDRKSIRPAREGDAARLAALEVQASALRTQLVR